MEKLETTSIMLMNPENKVLLQLRDDKPTIPMPNTWSPLGGHFEEGETADECSTRELKEEIERTVTNFTHLFDVIETDERGDILVHFVHATIEDTEASKIPLHEGQKIEFFTEEEVQDLNCGWNQKEGILRAFKLMREKKLI